MGRSVRNSDNLPFTSALVWRASPAQQLRDLLPELAGVACPVSLGEIAHHLIEACLFLGRPWTLWDVST